MLVWWELQTLVRTTNSLVYEVSLNNKACIVYACVLVYDLYLMTTNTLDWTTQNSNTKTPYPLKKRWKGKAWFHQKWQMNRKQWQNPDTELRINSHRTQREESRVQTQHHLAVSAWTWCASGSKTPGLCGYRTWSKAVVWCHSVFLHGPSR